MCPNEYVFSEKLASYPKSLKLVIDAVWRYGYRSRYQLFVQKQLARGKKKESTPTKQKRNSVLILKIHIQVSTEIKRSFHRKCRDQFKHE